MRSDAATSDLVAVMALIAVFMTAAAIAGVTLLSYPPGDAAPAMLMHTEADPEEGNVYVYHDGGDPLERGRFTIFVDGADRTADAVLIDASGSPDTGWTSWKTGQVLIISADATASENPRVQIVGEGVSQTGSGWLLHDTGDGTGVGPTQTITSTPTGTVTPTLTATATPTSTPVNLVASFTASPTSGPAPLTVAFTDTSTGGATSWSWTFGDGGTSTLQNPSYTYAAAGTYTVTLKVTNAGGSDTETKVSFVTVTEHQPPTAAFSADVTTGAAPLAVHFIDGSTNGPTSWLWVFGDGATSTEQNPEHTYMAPGMYTVSLTVAKAGVSDIETKMDYIAVTPPPAKYDALLNTDNGKPGSLMPGGYLEFRVTKNDSYVTISGTRYDLVKDNRVKLVIGTDGNGEIYINGPRITTFSYNDVTLYINDVLKKEGKTEGIYINAHDTFASTLTLNVPSKNKWTKLSVDDNNLIDGDDSRQIVLYNMMPGTDGVMNLNSAQNKIWFVGSITDYTLG